MIIVLDLDDTLYPERAYVKSGFEAVGDWMLQHQKISSFAEVCWRKFEAGERKSVFNRALIEFGIEPSAEIVAKLVSVYREHRPNIELFPDAAEFLAVCAAERRTLALVTDGRSATQRLKVSSLNIAQYFSKLVVTDDLGRQHWKPSVLPFTIVEEAFGSHRGPFAYIGDNSSKDFIGPNQLGWVTLQVSRETGIYADADVPFGGAPAFTASDLKEALAILKSLAR